MDDTIPIVFAMDVNYLPYASVATYSLVKNSVSPLKIYWMLPHQDLGHAAEYLNCLADKNINVLVVPIGIDVFDTWKENGHIARSTYFRLLIPDYINERKIIYLDCDILVLSDLSEFYKTEMGLYPVGGVAESAGPPISKMPWHLNDIYINAGVLLLNLDALRCDNFLEKCKQLYAVYQEDLIFLDQCIINKYAENQKFLFDRKWNQQFSQTDLYESAWLSIASIERSNIIHFIGAIKPWQDWCYPIVTEFWWQFANELNLPNLRPTAITTINQKMYLAAVYEINEKYKEACSIQSVIIQDLLAHLAKK